MKTADLPCWSWWDRLLGAVLTALWHRLRFLVAVVVLLSLACLLVSCLVMVVEPSLFETIWSAYR